MNDHKKPKGAGKSSFELIDADLLSRTLSVKPGSVILDLACGKGLYTLFLSGLTGAKGSVYAADLWPEGLELLEKEIENRKIGNIKPLLIDATRSIPITDHSVDVCLMATVLHDFAEVDKAGVVLDTVKGILKPGGLLAVIEFKKIEGPPGPPITIRLSESDVETLAARHGFSRQACVDLGAFNYLILLQAD